MIEKFMAKHAVEPEDGKAVNALTLDDLLANRQMTQISETHIRRPA